MFEAPEPLMRFAALPFCLFLTIAAAPAMAEDVADGMIGAGLRSAEHSDGAVGFARLSFDAPLSEGIGLRGRLDVIGSEAGAATEIELGAGLRIGGEDWSAFADLRYGNVAEGTFAVTGIDILARSGPLTLGAGPRFVLAGEGYATRLDGLSASTMQFDDGAPDEGGLLTAGLRLSARYDVAADWGLEGAVQVDRFLLSADTLDTNPAGSAARLTASIMATHRFQFEF